MKKVLCSKKIEKMIWLMIGVAVFVAYVAVLIAGIKETKIDDICVACGIVLLMLQLIKNFLCAVFFNERESKEKTAQ